MNPLKPIFLLVRYIFRLLFSSEPPSVYALDHAILNLPVPPPTMWMNMGYWKDESDLPAACKALLHQVLITAGLLDPSGHPTPVPRDQRLHLVDVGIGCGDQSLELLRLQRKSVTSFDTSDEGKSEPLFDSYIGITDLPVQADVARQRLRDPHPHPQAQIHAADASNPPSWPDALTSAIAKLNPKTPSTPSEEQDSTTTTTTTTKTYVLALDTLYHFRPSRKPFLTMLCAGTDTNPETTRPTLLAFDLLRADTLSLTQSILLRLICWISGTPCDNFLPRAEYEALLVNAGYSLDRIELRDISDHVFGGLAAFIRRKEKLLRAYGLSVGRFRGATVAFDWWARSGVVRGVVVVARG